MHPHIKKTLIVLVVVILGCIAWMSPATVAQGRQIAALAPKPATLTPYTAPHKPHWKLSEILAMNAGKQS